MSDSPITLPPITLQGETTAAYLWNDVAVTIANAVAHWTSGFNVDVDGAPNAYNLNSALGLDRLANAQDGKCGWPGVYCGPDGKPIVRPGGWLIAQTALRVPGFANDDPRHYVDATRVRFISGPPELLTAGASLGDVGIARYNARSAAFVLADIGPHKKIGEGSPCLALALGINPDARSGGVDCGVECTLYLGSGKGWPRTNDDVAAQVALLQKGNS